MAIDRARNADWPRDPIEDDIAEAMADPDLVASLREFEVAEDRGEPLPTFSTDEVWAYIEEERRKRRGC